MLLWLNAVEVVHQYMQEEFYRLQAHQVATAQLRYPPKMELNQQVCSLIVVPAHCSTGFCCMMCLAFPAFACSSHCLVSGVQACTVHMGHICLHPNCRACLSAGIVSLDPWDSHREPYGLRLVISAAEHA